MTETARYGGFWRRVGAHLIDSLIYLPPALAALYGLYGPEYFDPERGFGYMGFGQFLIDDFIPLALVVWLWCRFGATPGKHLLHLKVVDLRTGGSLRWGQALLRYFAYFVSLLPLGLGFLWVIWDERRQSFHDKIAGTLVVVAQEDESTKSMEQLLEESR